jgi:transposase
LSPRGLDGEIAVEYRSRVPEPSTTPTSQVRSTEERVAELEAALAAERAALAALTVERDTLRLAYRNAQQELELMRRRLFVAKAERLDTSQLELEFAHKLAALDALNQQLGAPVTADGAAAAEPDDDAPSRPRGGKPKPTGRRDLRDHDLPEERIELLDPALEGAATRIGWEESCQLSWRRACYVRTVIARAKYREGTGDESTLVTAPLPPQILPRALATASLLAHVVSEKFCDGMPFHRQEDRTARLGLRIDRGTMCRWAEELGALVGSGVVEAMRDEALRTAFCISTDATGVLLQPIRGGDQQRRSCRRGHFLVQIADADHIFFEYMPKETSAAIGELFHGFSGYIQADAKSVYDLLFTPPDRRRPPDDGEHDLAERHEVGCWSHCRRKMWETAITSKDPVAREGVLRIKRIFDLDRSWRGKPPAEIKSLRDLHLRPHTDAFFAWVAVEYERVKGQRGMLRSALGYAHRQRGPLTRFFDDGRLKLTNNESERELRRVAVGRKAWLFIGSDDHAQAAGNLLTLVASARLHRLDPEAYLRDVFRVFPHWPRDRYLELAPRYWLATRARLDPAQLERELGPLDVPPLPSSEQPAAR